MFFLTPSRARPVIGRIRELEPEILGHLRRVFPEVPRDARLRFRPLRVDASHAMVLVETAKNPVRRLLIKGPRTYDGSRQRVEHENWVLTEVAPRISADNPSTRCPQVLAYYPDRELLLLEMVGGTNLRSLLCGRAQLRGRASLPELLGLCGQWLARFHSLTRSGDEGNPFEWLGEALASPSSRMIFANHADHNTHELLQDVVKTLRREHADFLAPRCMIHGSFTPYHVLVQDDRIYVIDFEGGRIGYAYEDLAFFAAYYDILPPWRRALGARRIDLREQQRIFLESYLSRSAPLRQPERLILRLARLLAIARFLFYLEGAKTRTGSLRFRVLGPWWRHRFRLACREELKALQEVSGEVREERGPSA